MSERTHQASAQPIAFAATPHLVDPSGVLGIHWLEPAGVLVRFMHLERGTAEMSHWMTTAGLELLSRRFAGRTDMRVVLDMRNMIGRSATARSLLMQAGSVANDRIEHVVILPSQHMGSAYIKVIEASAIALRLLGYRVDVEHELEHALKKHGLRTQLLSDVRPVLAR